MIIYNYYFAIFILTLVFFYISTKNTSILLAIIIIIVIGYYYFNKIDIYDNLKSNILLRTKDLNFNSTINILKNTENGEYDNKTHKKRKNF